LNGVRHRSYRFSNYGPAIENQNNHKEWWQFGKRHRTDGPAIEYQNGHKEWWQFGKWHRIDGPAIEYLNGDTAWYLNGNNIKPYYVIKDWAQKDSI
jgi:hypothetical protein